MSESAIEYTSFASLEKDVVQLKECMEFIHENVQMQQEQFDTIEDVILTSHQDVKQSHQDMVVADTYQSDYRFTLAAIGSGIVGAVAMFFLL